VDQCPSSLANISGWAVTTGTPHGLLLRRNWVFHMSQDVSQCCQGLETCSDTQWSQYSSDRFRGVVYIGDDHSSVWGSVVIMLVV